MAKWQGYVAECIEFEDYEGKWSRLNPLENRPDNVRGAFFWPTSQLDLYKEPDVNDITIPISKLNEIIATGIDTRKLDDVLKLIGVNIILDWSSDD